MQVVYAMEKHLPVIQQLAYAALYRNNSPEHSRRALSQQLEEQYSTDAIKAKIIDQGHTFFLVKSGNEFLGYAYFECNYRNEAITQVHQLVIHPSILHQEVNKFLLDAIIREAIAEKNTTIQLNNGITEDMLNTCHNIIVHADCKVLHPSHTVTMLAAPHHIAPEPGSLLQAASA